MKKGLLLFLSMSLGFATIAQVAQFYPNGFRKANVPAALREYSVKVPYRSKFIDNQVPVITNVSLPRVGATQQPIGLEDIVGCTYYDLQTNNSISNRLVVSDDGSISAAWTFSPDAIQTTSPPYPNRGTGYNYYDGSAWTGAGCPMTRSESSRTGFTNIAVTASGKEMTIAHAAVGNFNRIALNWRATKGTGAWTLSYPWGSTATDTWPKACAAGESVYAIWQGSGAGATTTTPAPIVEGQSGPIYFTRSLDGGVTWDAKKTIALIDSNFYKGFGGDSYGIDAKDSIVAITYGDTYTDVGLLKSTDYGQTWTKTIIQTHPYPFYSDSIVTPDINGDTVIDSKDAIKANGGDPRVLIDNNGMCHVWFSLLYFYNDSANDGFYSPLWGTDELEYWNENLPTDGYVGIAAAQDYNGNDSLDYPLDTFTTCNNALPWGNYGSGITAMPSAGIDVNGRIYMTYQTINESADTTNWHECHRHVYMMTLSPPYNVGDWTYPYNIVPSIADGGFGEQQEAVFASTARRVDNTYAYVLYQRDEVPGHSLATDGTCDKANNLGNSSDIVVAKIDVATVSAKTATQNNLFVSQNYPNPASGMTFINIGLKKASTIKFEVYDLIGKVVYSETNKMAQAGTHTISVNTTNFKSGIYTYSVIADGQKTTRKMVVQK